VIFLVRFLSKCGGMLMMVVGGDSGGWEAPIEAVGKRL
jgi:hypothetical protein